MRRAMLVVAIGLFGLVGCDDDAPRSASTVGDTGVEDGDVGDDAEDDVAVESDAREDEVDRVPPELLCDPLDQATCVEGEGCYVSMDVAGGLVGFECRPAGTASGTCTEANDCAAGSQCFMDVDTSGTNSEPSGCFELCRAGVDVCSGECRSFCDAGLGCEPELDELGVCMFLGG